MGAVKDTIDSICLLLGIFVFLILIPANDNKPLSFKENLKLFRDYVFTIIALTLLCYAAKEGYLDFLMNKN